MKLTELTALGIRLAGLVLLVLVYGEGKWLIQNLVEYGNYGGGLFVFLALYSALQIAAIIVMIAFPVTLAKLLVPRSTDESPVLNIETAKLEMAGLTILGSFMLVMAIPDLFYNLIELGMHKYQVVALEREELWITLNNLITTLIEMGVAGYALMGAPSLLRMVYRLRTFGLENK